jgi:hypothetical protein
MGIYTFSIHGDSFSQMYCDAGLFTYRPEFPSYTNTKTDDCLWNAVYRGDQIWSSFFLPLKRDISYRLLKCYDPCFLSGKNPIRILVWTDCRHPRWSSGSVLDTGPKVRGFKPGRRRWIFKGDKNP